MAIKVFLWTEDQTNAARVLFHAGKSASEAANELARQYRKPFTRSAIIGKWTRLGLKKAESGLPRGKRTTAEHASMPRIKRSSASGIVSRMVRAAAQRIAVEESEPIDTRPLDDMESAKHACSLFEFTNITCRWPIGHPGTPDFFFCGIPEAALDQQRPYCRGHSRIARGG